MLGTNSPASSSCHSKLFPSFLFIWIAMRLPSPKVLVSRSPDPLQHFSFPNHSSLFCIFSAACLRKGIGRPGLSVINPVHAQITIKTLFLIGNSERALPPCPFSQVNAVAWLLIQNQSIHPTLSTPSRVSLRAIWNLLMRLGYTANAE
jgi:hypothetical protein